MKFIEAAILILKQNDNKPLSSKEIWNKISEQNLVESGGKTPWASLNTILLCSSVDSPIDKIQLERHNKEYRDIVKIVSHNPNKFILTDKILSIEIEKKEDISISKLYQKMKPEIIIESKRKIIYQMTCEELNWKCLTLYQDDDHIDYDISEIKEYTYIFDDTNKLIKIGKTSQETPINRLNGFKTANPAIFINIVFPSTLYTEKFLHNKFDDYREDMGREWFFKTKVMTNFILEHKQKNKIALDWYYKQIDIEKVQTQILNW